MVQSTSMVALARSVAFLLVFAFTAYGARFALGDNESRHDEESRYEEARHAHPTQETLKLTSLLEISDEDGAELYMTRCMSCHQMNGRGISGVFPPLAGADWVTGDKGRLIRIVLNGLTGEIDVEGETYSGAMPPWNSFLDDDQTAALLTYIRSSWGNEASEVTPAEVSKVRAATKDRREPWTEEELNQDENRGIPGEENAGGAEGRAKSDSSKTGDKK